MKISVKDIFTICLLSAAPMPWLISIGGLSGLYIYEILTIICLIMIWQRRLYHNAKWQLIDQSRYKFFTLIGSFFILFAFLGLFINFLENAFGGAKDITVYLKMTFHVIITILVILGSFLGGFSLFKGEQDLLRVSWILFIAFFATSLQTVISWIINTGCVIGRYNYEPPTGLGQGDTSKILILGFFITFFLLMSINKQVKKNLIFLSLLIFGVSILSIQSRAAYVIFILQSLFLIYLTIKPLKKRTISVSGFMIILTMVCLLYFIVNIAIHSGLSQNINENVLNQDSAESLNKLIVIQDGINLFMNNPVFGIGWGQFGLNTTALMVVSGIGDTVASPHNGLIQLLSETGILGTFTALYLCYLTVKYIFSQYKSQQNEKTKLFFGILLIIFLTIIITQFIVSSYLFPPPTQRSSIRSTFYYWFLIGYAWSFLKKN